MPMKPLAQIESLYHSRFLDDVEYYQNIPHIQSKVSSSPGPFNFNENVKNCSTWPGLAGMKIIYMIPSTI